MLSVKFKIWKWEISIRDATYDRQHITEFPKPNFEALPVVDESYCIDPTNTEKRVSAMANSHGMIDYIFRGLGTSLLTYHKDAVILLNGVMQSLSQIRNDLWVNGATTTELDRFDRKVHEHFQLMLRMIKEKAEDPKNELRTLDKHLYDTVRLYDIQNYQSGNNYR